MRDIIGAIFFIALGVLFLYWCGYTAGRIDAAVDAWVVQQALRGAK